MLTPVTHVDLTKEETDRLLRIISSIRCLQDERPNLTSDADRDNLDALVERLAEMIPENLRVLL